MPAEPAPELSDPSGRRVAPFFSALLRRFADIVGEGAGYATFHFAAIQEGIAFARERGGDDERLLKAAHAWLGHDAKAELGPDKVVVRAHGSPLLTPESRLMHGVVLGFYEGLLKDHQGPAYEGEIAWDDDGVATMTFRRRGAP